MTSPLHFQHHSVPTYVYWMFGTLGDSYLDTRYLFAKTGIADNMQRRLGSLHTHCPVTMQFVLCIPCNSRDAAYALEDRFKSNEDMNTYKTHGEWFIVSSGEEEHAIFLKNVIATFYSYRNEDPSRFTLNMAWYAAPFPLDQFSLIMGATAQQLTVSQQEIIAPDAFLGEHSIQSLWVDAEIKGEGFAHCIHADASELADEYQSFRRRRDASPVGLYELAATFPLNGMIHKQIDDYERAFMIHVDYPQSP